MHTLTKNKVTKKYEMDMCSGSLLPKIIVFTLPLILSGMLQLMFNAADIVVAGRYVGEEALAAVGSTGSLVNLLVNVFMGVSIGTNVLVARYYGAGQKKDLEETVHTAILTAIIGGFCLIIIGFFVSRPILRWMDTPDNVIEGSVLYIRIYFGGMPFFMLYNFGSAILRAIGDTKRPTKYLLFAGVINVILNLIFVIAFKMSVAGVALATVISQAISAVLVLRCLVRSPGVYQVVLRNLRIIPNKFIKMLRIGIPAGIQGALFSISNVLIQSSVNSFGSTVMAGNMAAQNVEGFVYVAMNSFHQSAISFTGQNMGAGKFDRIKKIAIICLMLVFVIGFTLGNLVSIFREPLVGLYSQEAAVVKHGMARISVISSVHFFCGMMDVMVGVLRGMGYAIVPMGLSIAGVCGFRILWIQTVFRKIGTIQSLYLSYPVTWGTTFLAQLICFMILYRRMMKRAKTREREAIAQEAV